MRDLKNFRLDVWTDGKTDMCAIRADREENAEGLRWIWFVLTREELERIATGEQSTAEDGYHKATIWGDLWTFYDLEMPRESAGFMRVPFVRVNIPRLFLRALVRLARRVWTAQRAAVAQDPNLRCDKVEIHVSAKHRERVCRLYGQGKGFVKFEVEPETAARMAEDLREDEKFFRQLCTMQNIAINTTRGFHQCATVFVCKDDRDYYWVAKDPKGRRIMDGGLIDHGRRNGTHDWSIHT